MMSAHPTASSPSIADTAPLPPMWSLVSKGALAVGLALLWLTAPAVHPSQAYATSATKAVIGTPALSLRPAMAGPRPSHTARSATGHLFKPEASPTASTPSLEPIAARAVGWAALWAGLMGALGVALWNRMGALNAEQGAEGPEAHRLSPLAALPAAALALHLSAQPALAEIRLPPLDTDPYRCERAFTGNTIGQANAVSDRPLDLRQCDLKGGKFDGKTLSGALMVEGNFQQGSFVEAILSKVYAVRANFRGADFTSAVLDRGAFDGADMSGARFYNTVITGASFKGTDLSDTVFEENLIGSEDAKRLCANPTLTGESRDGVGCRD